jgi:hypothetical protein
MNNLFLWSKKGASFLTILSMVVSISMPFMLYPVTAYAAGSYTAVISPTQVASGSTTSYSVTFTNISASSGDKMKSATIVIPAGFTNITSLTATAASTSWVATQVGGEIQLSKNTSGADVSNGGGTLLVSFSATAPNPGSDTAYQWTTTGCKDDSFPCPSNGSKIFTVGGSQPSVLVTAPTTGTITVVKKVLSPDGVEIPSTQGFTVSLDNSISQPFLVGSPVVFSDVAVGSHVVIEDIDSSYELPVYTGDCDSSGNINIVAGDSKTCTITNKQKKGHLTIIKNVNNNAGIGTSDANDFSFQINGGSDIAVIANDGDLTGQNILEKNPGTYNVTELNSGNYAVGYNNCTNILLGSNGNATCTITNYDLTPGKGAITVNKALSKDNGGTASVGDFPLTITPAKQSPISVTSGQVSQLDPGVYTIGETMTTQLAEEYTNTSLVCTDNGNTMEGVTDGQITMEAGHVYQCTITNDDKPAHLTIVKNTGNTAYNGTFGFTISGTELTPSITTVAGTGQTGVIDLNKGSYDLQEVVPSGWSFSNVSCLYEGQSVGNSISNGENIVVDNGDDVTCTFTNARQTGNLTVIKNVQTTDETVTPDDFQIHVM